METFADLLRCPPGGRPTQSRTPTWALSCAQTALLSHTLFLRVLKSHSAGLLLPSETLPVAWCCVCFSEPASQRAVVVRCCFSIRGSDPLPSPLPPALFLNWDTAAYQRWPGLGRTVRSLLWPICWSLSAFVRGSVGLTAPCHSFQICTSTTTQPGAQLQMSPTGGVMGGMWANMTAQVKSALQT